MQRNTFSKHLSLAIAMAALLLNACSKEDNSDFSNGGRIVFNVSGDLPATSAETKTTAVKTVPQTLQWSATTGTPGSSEQNKTSSTSSSVSSGKLVTDMYQTASPTTYNYYLTNAPAITFSSGGSTIQADNGTDIVVGKASSSSTSVPVSLEHIFARTGSLNYTTSVSGYTVSSVSWKLQSKAGTSTGTSGTYNMAKETWSGTSALSSTTISSSSDLYLIPGTYTLSVSYTATIGDNTKSYSKSADITLLTGKINNISASLPVDTISPISFTISITDWTSQNVPVSF